MRPRTSTLDRPLARRANRALVHAIGPAVRRFRGFSVSGLEHVPAEGPALLACNHAAFTDSVWVHLAIGRPLVVAGAKPRLFRSAPLRALMALGNVLRVDDRDGFLADTTALLARGRCLLTYPELGRNPDGLGVFHPWTAELSVRTGVPVVPGYVFGTTTGHVGPPSVRFGAPLTGDDPDALTADLRAAVARLGGLA